MDENLNLNGEQVETPADSQSEITTPDAGDSVNQTGAANLSPEEVSWNDLSGPAQDRFREVTRQLSRERREKEELLANRPTETSNRFETLNNGPIEGAQEAVQKLDQIGIANKDYVDQKISQTVNALVYNSEIEKLGGRYDGSNGLPKFDRDEYENYVSIHPQYRNYLPEDVYQKMYSEEIFDWRAQNQKTGGSKPATNSTLRPNKTQVREEPLTPEMIEQRMQEPDGREWYEKNMTRVNAVMAKSAG